MKKVLCFGDSNTFGFNPKTGERYQKNERWSGILSDKAKNEFKIIEAGCNNRTCIAQNPQGSEYIGNKILSKYLKSDVDVVILALGINDVQFLFDVSIEEIKIGMEKLINISKNINPNIEIIIVSPSVISKDVLSGYFACQFNEISIQKSKHISKNYFDLSKKYDCKFLDLNEIAKVSKCDGLHYEIEEHKTIAEKIYQILKQ